MTVTDLAKILRSEEIQKALRAPIKEKTKRILKRNPLKNSDAMKKLNPYAISQRKKMQVLDERNWLEKQAILETKRE